MSAVWSGSRGRCDLADGQQQVLDGLSDRKFAVRWEEADDLRVNPALAGNPPPWREAEINWATGEVYCDRGLTTEGRAAGLARWLTPVLTAKMGTAFERMFAENRKAAIAATLPIAAAKPASRGGRKKGSGSKDDAERVRAMLSLLVNGQAHSVHGAACKVAEGIVGSSHSRSADINRLRRKFAKDHGTEPLAGKAWADVEDELNENCTRIGGKQA